MELFGFDADVRPSAYLNNRRHDSPSVTGWAETIPPSPIGGLLAR